MNLATTILNSGAHTLQLVLAEVSNTGVEIEDDQRDKLRTLGETMATAHCDLIDFLVDIGMITLDELREAIDLSDAQFSEYRT